MRIYESSMTDLPADDRVVDEQRIARVLKLALPALTLGTAVLFGLVVGLPAALLVLAAGALLGTIALLWASLRVLSGDAPLPADMGSLVMDSQGGDALTGRKAMLLRALKDLENERALGKLEPKDYDEVAATYRAELKTVLREIDEVLAPHRSKAEELIRSHLESAGLEPVDGPPAAAPATESEGRRRACAKCEASNESDARFCKACGASLAAEEGDA